MMEKFFVWTARRETGGSKMTAVEINQRLYESKKNRIRIYPCNNLRASNLGHPCERYLYLLIKHWEEQRPHDVGLQGIFDLGNAMENYTIQNIKEAGYEVITPTCRAWKIDKPLITGREDIRIKAENGELYPCEIKGLAPNEFNRLNSIEDFYHSKRYYVRGYPAQLQIYLYFFEKEKGFFALTNKITGETKVIEMPFDWDKADELLKKAERIYECIQSNELPEACEDMTVCEKCSLSHICTSKREYPDCEIDDGELEELIKQKEELRPQVEKFESIKEQIHTIVLNKRKVLAGNYLAQAKEIERKEYVVPAKKYWTVQIKKL